MQKSLRHHSESRNPESIENPGFRVALRLPGMTIFLLLSEFCKSLDEFPKIATPVETGVQRFYAYLKGLDPGFREGMTENPISRFFARSSMKFGGSFQKVKLMNSQKVVIPAQAGIQGICKVWKGLDSRFHGNDG